ncbi:MAG: hypothetical protein PHH62_06995, partial [Endomicrobiaceae bacterium]|nr:hypothetical protein [Endomicrobiaceae bacterium]
ISGCVFSVTDAILSIVILTPAQRFLSRCLTILFMDWSLITEAGYAFFSELFTLFIVFPVLDDYGI